MRTYRSKSRGAKPGGRAFGIATGRWKSFMRRWKTWSRPTRLSLLSGFILGTCAICIQLIAWIAPQFWKADPSVLIKPDHFRLANESAYVRTSRFHFQSDRHTSLFGLDLDRSFERDPTSRCAGDNSLKADRTESIVLVSRQPFSHQGPSKSFTAATPATSHYQRIRNWGCDSHEQ